MKSYSSLGSVNEAVEATSLHGSAIDTQRVVDLLIELCSADSAPFEEGPVFSVLRRKLQELGFAVVEDETGDAVGGQVGNLVATRPGRGALARAVPRLFCAHMDRAAGGKGVRPVVEHGVVRAGGATILGADDAAGIAAILEAVTALDRSGSDHAPLELVFTIAEEAGLVGAKHLDTSRLKSRYGFVLDADGPVGSLVVRAPAQCEIAAKLFGRAAHADTWPEKGLSAVKMAAVAVSRMRLGRIDGETTANVSYIAGGGPTDLVPERAELRAEARSIDPRKLERQVAHMREALERTVREFGGALEWEVRPACSSFDLHPECEPVRRARAAACSLGISTRLVGTGSGSDANVFNAKGIECVVLGVGFEKIHTHNERMPVDELVRLSHLVARIMQAA